MRQPCNRRQLSGLTFLTAVVLLWPATATLAQDAAAVPQKGRRLQTSLQTLEEARAYLSLAESRSSAELRPVARQAAQDVDAAIAGMHDALAKAKVPRTIDRPRPSSTDRPFAAAQKALTRAANQLGDVDEDYRPLVKAPVERARLANQAIREAVKTEPAIAATPAPGDDTSGTARDQDRDRPRDGNRDRNRDDSVTGGSSLNGLPAAVQQTVRDNAPGLRIREVKREGEGGGEKGIVYKIEGTADTGGKVEMQVAENGDLLKFEQKGDGDGESRGQGKAKGKDKNDKKDRKDKDD